MLCPLEVGREYCLSIDVCGVTTGIGDFVEIGLGLNEGGSMTIGTIPASASSGTYTFNFIPDQPYDIFYGIFNDLNLYGCVNSVSLQVCEPAPPLLRA
jgi:hypothetical protein